jgi:class 3 adenylate cyclase
MESHCVADGIQVTEKTRSHLDSKYVFHDRGKIEVKGKGGMQVYLLEGRRSFPE